MNDKLLSQSDIDSLVSSMASKEQPASEKGEELQSGGARPPVSQAPATQPTEESAGTPSVKQVSAKEVTAQTRSGTQSASGEAANDASAKLMERLKRLEAKVQKLEQYEKVRSGIGPTPVSAQQYQELVTYVQKMGEEVRNIMAKLQGTPDYDIYHNFKCEKCGTQQQVAAVFLCTCCGHKSWRGWWPKNGQPDFQTKEVANG
jgi:hypothetical protein